jgi:hypothetical protein
MKGWFGVTARGKGGVYHITDLVRQAPRGEREEGDEEEEGLPVVCLGGLC